jgi:uncharacterized protein YbaP (TraB family)
VETKFAMTTSPIRWLLLALAMLAATGARAEAYLWEVSSLTNKVYLYGTVHAGKKEWYPLPAVVEDAFLASDVLVVEADITDTTAMAKSANATHYAPPDSLKRHVPAEEYARFLKFLPRFSIREQQVERLKPFMAVSVLVFSEWAREGFLPEYGVDAYLIRKAKAEVKPVVEIEGIAAQIRLMDTLTDVENQALFKGTLDALDVGLTGEQVKGMVVAWQGGDATRLLAVAREYNERVVGAAQFEEKFVWARHADMLAKIEGYLNDSKERYFIAVGALHLAGPRGLIELLKKRGYVVKQR